MAKAKKNIVDMDLFCSAKDALQIEKSKSLLPLSPALDFRLGGGIPEGSLVLIQGKAKCGKTLSAVEIAANALKQGRYVFYFDTECRMTASKYFTVDGFDILNNPKFFLMNSESSKDGEIISGDKMYGMIIQMMKMPKYKGSVYIVDSLSNVITQECLDDPEVTHARRDSSPKLNADFCKKVAPYIRKSNAILVGIQHLQASQNPQLHGALEPIGGARLAYSSDIVLLSKHNPLDLNGDSINSGFEKGAEGLDGLLVRYDLPYNKLLGPYVAKDKDEKIHNYYKFGKGCWKSREIIDVLNQLGLINYGKSGWITFLTDKFTDKVQGAEKAAEIIDTDLDYFESLLKNHYIETYGVNYNFNPSDEEDE